MAIGVIFNFPGGTTEQYDEVCRGLNNGQPLRSLADWPGGGCLSHVAGATAGPMYCWATACGIRSGPPMQYTASSALRMAGWTENHSSTR